MPDREVKTIKDLIYYQYAKIIAKSAMGADAKTSAYGFIKNTFRKLKNDEKKWSEILREDKQLVEAEKKCVYCGATSDLQWEHIVPKTLLVNEKCPACDRIQGIHNQIWACKSCNSKKGTKGLYRFYREQHPEAKKLSDIIPALLEKKYLKTIYYCHLCNGTLEYEGNGEGLTVLDLDITIK
jgi:5-methylcytosine-specific restriction endonuclease McrA